MKILQRNLNRSTFVVWEMKRNVFVVCVCSAPDCCDTEHRSASQPGSVACGTSYIKHPVIRNQHLLFLTVTKGAKIFLIFNLPIRYGPSRFVIFSKLDDCVRDRFFYVTKLTVPVPSSLFWQVDPFSTFVDLKTFFLSCYYWNLLTEFHVIPEWPDTYLLCSPIENKILVIAFLLSWGIRIQNSNITPAVYDILSLQIVHS